MTAQGEDILAWTSDAITRRESAARCASPGPWVPGGIGDYGWTVHTGVRSFETEDSEIGQADARHIALNSPSTVLRRCAADRKLLELHAPQPDGTGFPDGMQCRTCSLDGGDGYQYLVPAPCPTILALAEGYGWTRGER